MAGASAGNFCSFVPSPRQPPVHAASSWGQWVFLGDTGVAIKVSRVDSKTLTWEFFNGRSDSITSLNFNYSYVDADTGQNTNPEGSCTSHIEAGHRPWRMDGLHGKYARYRQHRDHFDDVSIV